MTKTEAAEIGAEGIGKSFGSFAALTDVSLTIGRGEFLTLLGPSGSGKTTFLMILAGFEAATRGRLTLDGSDMTLTPAEARAFGMVFQGYALFPHMTVEENIAFPLKVQRRSAGDIKRRVSEMVEMVGLGGHGHKRPSGLSGGQQQRLCIARGIAIKPEVLLLDEPCSALDPISTAKVEELISELKNDYTVVIVTHNMQQAARCSDYTAYMYLGDLVEFGATEQIFFKPNRQETEDYITGRFG